MRDPRYDPQPGDVLTPANITNSDIPRYVTSRPDKSTVAYRIAPNRPITHCLLLSWQDWCRRTDARASRV